MQARLSAWPHLISKVSGLCSVLCASKHLTSWLTLASLTCSGNHEASDINALFGFRLECLERLGDAQVGRQA